MPKLSEKCVFNLPFMALLLILHNVDLNVEIMTHVFGLKVRKSFCAAVCRVSGNFLKITKGSKKQQQMKDDEERCRHLQEDD